ncbi:MAG: hypothetical protein AMXMBFR33_48560 [Candidatus Xenobia bacterium]
MKKVLFVFFLLVAGAIALLAFGGDGVGFKWPSLKSILQWGSKPAPKPGEVSGFGEADPNTNEDARFIRDRTADFLEDIRFKDFEKAASYSSSVDRSKVNMPRLITQLFKFPPESLDILSSEVVSVELDRSGTRGRVKTHSRVKILNFDRFEEPELIFYWHKDPKEYWVMKLESSINH